MDNPPRSINNDIQTNIQKEHLNGDSHHGNFLQPTWFCGIIRPGRILDWFLSNNRWYFLCRVNLFIHPLLFIIKKMGI